MWSKIKTFISRNILDIFLFLALFLSIYSSCRSYINFIRIQEVSSQVVQVQEDVANLNKALIERLDVMQSQLDFITKYSEANYLFFYGDVDGRVNSNNKNVNKSKK